MASKLIIDLTLCDQCRCGTVNPSQHQREPPVAAARQGSACSVNCMAISALREKATFELICRRCEQASCILACPFNALERTDDGVVRRHNLRCVSCKSCAVACPFGTIYTELLPFYSLDYRTSCEDCLTRLGSGDAMNGNTPACVGSCARGALDYREILPEEDSIQSVDEYLAVRLSPAARPWIKMESAS